jgi:predicted AlkP superfamily phosphohydrolase/phosphomutase
MAGRARKCVVVGIDGADFRLYRQWMNAGITPHLARLAQRGRMGVLQSTFPPVTGPAWVSLGTGEQPGSHGITGFFAPSAGARYTRDAVSTYDVSSPFLWEIAGRHGRKSLVVNVPLTWPARPFDGLLVTGMLTPRGARFTHPAAYEPELRLLQPDYRQDVAWQTYRNRGHDLVRDQKAATRARVELSLKLLAAKPWDLFMVVFTGSDRLQHCLFDHVEQLHDAAAVRDSPLTAAVRDYFVSLDEWIGEILAEAGPDVDVFVVSDHGFGPLEKTVHFNRWLADEGLLVRSGTDSSENLRRWKQVLNRVGIRRNTLQSMTRALNLGKAAAGSVERLNPFVAGVDWDRTRAYYQPTNGFRVNLRGREFFGSVPPEEYEAVRDDLIRRLLALRDPENGRPMVPIAKRREEMFAGPQLENLPDVFIDFGDGPYDAFSAAYDVPAFTTMDEWSCGSHRRTGLFVCAGPDLATGDAVPDLNVFDVAPNVLHALGVPIPDSMDGRFRADLFREPGEPRFEAADRSRSAVESLREDEREDLKRQLKSLGYL